MAMEPTLLHTCETQTIATAEEGLVTCGKPALAYWIKGKKRWLCQEHSAVFGEIA